MRNPVGERKPSARFAAEHLLEGMGLDFDALDLLDGNVRLAARFCFGLVLEGAELQGFANGGAAAEHAHRRRRGAPVAPVCHGEAVGHIVLGRDAMGPGEREGSVRANGPRPFRIFGT